MKQKMLPHDALGYLFGFLTVQTLKELVRVNKGTRENVFELVKELRSIKEIGVPLSTFLELRFQHPLKFVRVYITVDAEQLLPTRVTSSLSMLLSPSIVSDRVPIHQLLIKLAPKADQALVQVQQLVHKGFWRSVWDTNSHDMPSRDSLRNIIRNNLTVLYLRFRVKNIGESVFPLPHVKYGVIFAKQDNNDFMPAYTINELVDHKWQKELCTYDLGLQNPLEPPSVNNPPFNTFKGNWITENSSSAFSSRIEFVVILMGFLLVNNLIFRTKTGRVVARYDHKLTKLITRALPQQMHKFFTQTNIVSFRINKDREKTEFNLVSPTATSIFDAPEPTRLPRETFLGWHKVLHEGLPWYSVDGVKHDAPY